MAVGRLHDGSPRHGQPRALLGPPAGFVMSDDDVFAELLEEESRAAWRDGFPPCRLAADHDGVLGRHVVAVRDISAGEVILRCKPLAVGPKATGDPVCLGCCRTLGGPGRTAHAAHACEGCGWPLCSRACQRSPLHREECEALAALASQRSAPSVPSGDHVNAPESETEWPGPWRYAGVLPLRCLLLQGAAGRAVGAMQSHLEHRVEHAAPYRAPHGAQHRAAAFVRDTLVDVDVEAALRMAAVLDTNAFDVSRDGTEARALFGSVSMLSHDCRSNARCAMLGPELLELGVLAQRDIAAGSVISISYYGDSLSGSLQRRRHLRATKCFDCTCARCADPTDLGLHLDSVRCIQCSRQPQSDGALLEPASPTDLSSDWRCPRCGFTLSADQMIMGHRRLRSQVAALRFEDPVDADAFLDEHLGPGGLLHPTSAHVLHVKQSLLGGLYAHIPGCTPPPGVDDAALAGAVEMCGEMLVVVAVLDPGLSVLRGALLLRLAGLLLERARRSHGSHLLLTKDDVGAARQSFLEAESIFMDLETRTELQKRKKMAEEWIKENITTTGA